MRPAAKEKCVVPVLSSSGRGKTGQTVRFGGQELVMTMKPQFTFRLPMLLLAALMTSAMLVASTASGEARNGSYGAKVSGGLKKQHYSAHKRFHGKKFRHKGRFAVDSRRSGVRLGRSSGKVYSRHYGKRYRKHHYHRKHAHRPIRQYVKPGYRYNLPRHKLRDGVTTYNKRILSGNDFYYPLPIDDGRDGIYYTEVIPAGPPVVTECPAGFNCGYRLYENGTGPRIITPGVSGKHLPPQDGISGPHIIRLGD